MNLTQTILSAVALTVAVSVSSQADVMDMRSVGDEPPNSAAGVERPKSGLSMDRVRQRFGEPLQIIGAVGEPPITRWVYDRYTVYFEHHLVIHSVPHPQK